MASISVPVGRNFNIVRTSLRDPKHVEKGIAAQEYKKLLIINKESRLLQLKRKGILMTPFIEHNYKQSLLQIHREHHAVCQTFARVATSMGKQVRMICESDVTQDDVQDADLVVSMGGDKCFLKACSILENGQVPILGINTNPCRYLSSLNNHEIEFAKREDQSLAILETVEDDHFVAFEKRTRLLFEREHPPEEDIGRKILVLNEAFCAERDGTSASRYCIQADGKDLGVFKSSGLIVSTGTGSTGWLYASRQITSQQLEDVEKILGTIATETSCNVKLAKDLSDETKFGRETEQMYYFIREGIGNLRGVSEGFAKHMKITSEMFEGKVIIDGWYAANLAIGDAFTMSVAEDNYLKAMKLDLGPSYYKASVTDKVAQDVDVPTMRDEPPEQIVQPRSVQQAQM